MSLYNKIPRKITFLKSPVPWFRLWTSRARYLPTPKELTDTIRGFNPQEKYIFGLFVFIFVGALFAGAVQFYLIKTTAVPARGGEYREALVGFPEFINPLLSSTNVVDRDLTRLIYAGLMRYNNQGEIVPDLAETYEISDGGRTYRFKLRENLMWEDGTRLTAEDVVFTIKLLQDPQYDSPLQNNWNGIDVESEGDDRVIFKLSSSYVPFLENATIGILPSHIWKKIPASSFRISELNLHPIGSGPFKAEKFVKTKTREGEYISSYTLIRNENYYAAKPYLNKIIFKFYNTEAEAITAFNVHAVDGMAFLSSINRGEINDIKTLTLHEFYLPRYFSIFINQEENSLLEDKRVREALAYAIDRDKIIESALGGFAQKVDTPLPPNLTTYYNQSIKPIPYDHEEAKRILEDANWIDSDGDGIREKILKQNDEPTRLAVSLTTLQWPELEAVALAVTEQWHALGVEAIVEFEDIGTMQREIIRPRDYEMLLFGEILGILPDPYSFWHSSQKNHPGLNLARYDSKDVDKLLENAREELDDVTRVELLGKFQEKVVQDIPAIFLYDPTYLYPVHRGVGGINHALIADPSERFVDVTSWYIETKRVF